VEEEEQRDGESRGLDRGMIGRSRREYALHPLHREGGESEASAHICRFVHRPGQEGATHRIFAISRVTGAAYLVAL
jgi:hypothetical protein